MDVTDGNRIPMGYQQITDLSAAVGLTVPSADIGGRTQSARLAMIRAETKAVRYRDDGSNPTASVGMPLEYADGFLPYTGDLSKLKFIEQEPSASLSVLYYY